jgi:hypothetical protein
MATEPAASDWHSHGLERPIWVEPDEEQAGPATVVAKLERVVRAHPTQWFNFFDAWSPPGGHA